MARKPTRKIIPPVICSGCSSLRFQLDMLESTRLRDNEYLITRAMQAEAALAETLAALKAAEWGFNAARCIVCAGWNMSECGETDRIHTPDCIVGLALKRHAQVSEAPANGR